MACTNTDRIIGGPCAAPSSTDPSITRHDEIGASASESDSESSHRRLSSAYGNPAAMYGMNSVTGQAFRRLRSRL
ncbi:uncharacterized protein STEHIDRAFT_126207 [Stereum hirsutum FP-91666 SS1]|uniref:Uncharacterized protein n=1 Tax=Stereum hirsutum (strain FP-91666) TaxID=721885 RepID=R7RZI7_STEHR|nr:uncharacterized protein STEHIDRAFT_126207 [Stereum hirsutum FP-91666 SS1]EIM80248.1 hypothetical protein STEHIDRAFT_126207 [Stereum hirsutum FP-91666 SS1]